MLIHRNASSRKAHQEERMTESERLFARDIATIFRVSLSTARRYLANWERKHGPARVSRAGIALYTTWPALESFTPHRRAGPNALDQIRRLARRVHANERTHAEFESRLAQLGANMRRFEARLERLERSNTRV
jgi:hypothetical protein